MHPANFLLGMPADGFFSKFKLLLDNLFEKHWGKFGADVSTAASQHNFIHKQFVTF
jgi:hypothetical protein